MLLLLPCLSSCTRQLFTDLRIELKASRAKGPVPTPINPRGYDGPFGRPLSQHTRRAVAGITAAIVIDEAHAHWKGVTVDVNTTLASVRTVLLCLRPQIGEGLGP